MKKSVFILSLSLLSAFVSLPNSAYSTPSHLSSHPKTLTVYDQTAEEFMGIFKRSLHIGQKFFKTSDGSLEITCVPGLRASCSFKGVVNQTSLHVYDRSANQLVNVLSLEPNFYGDRQFLTSDEKLSLYCVRGLRAACTITIEE